MPIIDTKSTEIAQNISNYVSLIPNQLPELIDHVGFQQSLKSIFAKKKLQTARAVNIDAAKKLLIIKDSYIIYINSICFSAILFSKKLLVPRESVCRIFRSLD